MSTAGSGKCYTHPNVRLEAPPVFKYSTGWVNFSYVVTPGCDVVKIPSSPRVTGGLRRWNYNCIPQVQAEYFQNWKDSLLAGTP